ncbi:hypothetical protein ACSFA3_22570 [Variovorax sp. RHLX14]|uniref:hypothetical protein n=1 Tax=Variovorax sp. RHLX14 TaxID=1259731 RepID=UPI003F4617E4
MGEVFRRPQISKGLSRTDERQEVRADLERADNGYARSFEGVLGNRPPTLQTAQAPAEALLNELQRAEGYASTLTAALKAKRRALDETRASAVAAQQSHHSATAELASVSAMLAQTRQQLERASAQLNDSAAQLATTSQRLHGVLASTSWRVTAPLRDLSESFPRARALASRLLRANPFLRKLVRQSVKAIWWTATGQLGYRLALRRAQRKNSAPPLQRQQERFRRSLLRLKSVRSSPPLRPPSCPQQWRLHSPPNSWPWQRRSTNWSSFSALANVSRYVTNGRRWSRCW